MRLIEFVKGERKVTYRWASAPGVTQISKAQLVEKILHELSSHLGYRVSTSQLTKNSDDSQIIEAAYDLEALSVVKNPDEALAISRKIMPHVRSYFAKSKRRLTSTAPYLTLNEITIEAKSLDDYSKCFEPSDSESVIETIPLIEHLNVYRYIPSKRKNMKVKASKSTSRMRGGNYLEI
jgi:hypothetical protein